MMVSVYNVERTKPGLIDIKLTKEQMLEIIKGGVLKAKIGNIRLEVSFNAVSPNRRASVAGVPARDSQGEASASSR